MYSVLSVSTWTLKGQLLNIKTLRSGDLVVVHLAVRATETVPDALVVDLLPAGLELENQNLAQSSASLTQASRALRELARAMPKRRYRSSRVP